MEKWTRSAGSEQDETWEGTGEDLAVNPRLPVVAFSRKFCSGARLVSDILSARLGHEVFGYRLINRITEDMHLNRRVVDRLDQESESAIRQLLDSFAARRPIRNHIPQFEELKEGRYLLGYVTYLAQTFNHIFDFRKLFSHLSPTQEQNP